MARPVSQDIIDLVRVVYARYGVGSFGFAGIKDLVPSHQYLSRLNNEGWITKCRPPGPGNDRRSGSSPLLRSTRPGGRIQPR